MITLLIQFRTNLKQWTILYTPSSGVHAGPLFEDRPAGLQLVYFRRCQDASWRPAGKVVLAPLDLLQIRPRAKVKYGSLSRSEVRRAVCRTCAASKIDSVRAKTRRDPYVFPTFVFRLKQRESKRVPSVGTSLCRGVVATERLICGAAPSGAFALPAAGVEKVAAHALTHLFAAAFRAGFGASSPGEAARRFLRASASARESR